ncbi:hypothetical protein AB0O07_15430 [Streptomyces sp. NPDC093085]|uniref:hypothetical protein n=1 Tax=Streptomyces sp. NPDC093085 TaxID=3155068 RepID=UPI00343BB1E1
MSMQDEMAAVRRRLDELSATVERLERRLARGDDADGSGPAPADRADELVPVPDTPYDTTLWTDSDDEGLGVRDRRAP